MKSKKGQKIVEIKCRVTKLSIPCVMIIINLSWKFHDPTSRGSWEKGNLNKNFNQDSKSKKGPKSVKIQARVTKLALHGPLVMLKRWCEYEGSSSRGLWEKGYLNKNLNQEWTPTPTPTRGWWQYLINFFSKIRWAKNEIEHIAKSECCL